MQTLLLKNGTLSAVGHTSQSNPILRELVLKHNIAFKAAWLSEPCMNTISLDRFCSIL